MIAIENYKEEQGITFFLTPCSSEGNCYFFSVLTILAAATGLPFTTRVSI